MVGWSLSRAAVTWAGGNRGRWERLSLRDTGPPVRPLGSGSLDSRRDSNARGGADEDAQGEAVDGGDVGSTEHVRAELRERSTQRAVEEHHEAVSSSQHDADKVRPLGGRLHAHPRPRHDHATEAAPQREEPMKTRGRWVRVTFDEYQDHDGKPAHRIVAVRGDGVIEYHLWRPAKRTKGMKPERMVICQWCLHRVMEYKVKGGWVWRCTNCKRETATHKKAWKL